VIDIVGCYDPIGAGAGGNGPTDIAEFGFDLPFGANRDDVTIHYADVNAASTTYQVFQMKPSISEIEIGEMNTTGAHTEDTVPLSPQRSVVGPNSSYYLFIKSFTNHPVLEQQFCGATVKFTRS
jgi:hypothetical protein